MLNVKDNRLSADQKALVEAFNAVADHFKERLLENKRGIISDDENLSTLIRDNKGEQVNSRLVEEGIYILREYVGNTAGLYSDNLKNAGTLGTNRYYVEEILIASNRDKKEFLAEQCRAAVLKGLVFKANELSELPRDYIRDESQRLGFIPKP
jgi:hypothetical protein